MEKVLFETTIEIHMSSDLTFENSHQCSVLLEYKASLEHRDSNSMSALHWAAATGMYVYAYTHTHKCKYVYTRTY